MKLKELLGKVVENKKNNQLNVNIKRGNLKKFGITQKELFNSEVNIKKLMLDNE